MTTSAKSGVRCSVSAVVSKNERPASRVERPFRFSDFPLSILFLAPPQSTIQN